MSKTRHLRVIFFPAILLILFFPLATQAQNIEPGRVLVRNVTLFDLAGKSEDRIVNILIRNQKLEVVTEDKISRDEADMVVNAKEGFRYWTEPEFNQSPAYVDTAFGMDGGKLPAEKACREHSSLLDQPRIRRLYQFTVTEITGPL